MRTSVDTLWENDASEEGYSLKSYLCDSFLGPYSDACLMVVPLYIVALIYFASWSKCWPRRSPNAVSMHSSNFGCVGPWANCPGKERWHFDADQLQSNRLQRQWLLGFECKVGLGVQPRGLTDTLNMELVRLSSMNFWINPGGDVPTHPTLRANPDPVPAPTQG